MAYLVIAAQQLRDDILALDPKAKITVPDEVDGFGFHRSIRVEGAAATKYGEALTLLGDNEPRIAEVVKSSKGVRVTMVADAPADHRDPFHLEEVLAVLNED